MTDFLDEKRREITDRLNELKPLVEEYTRLEAAAVGARRRRRIAHASRREHAGAADPGAHAARPGAAPPRPPRRKRPAKPGRPAKRRAGRRKGSGTRAAEALSFVQGQPGITIPELAAKMGIKQNYLYRVLPGLEQESKVEKQGRGWHPKS